MSTVLIIAIPVLLILAAVMIIATGRKRATSDPEGRVTGTLSAETRQTDQSVGGADRGRRRVDRGARAGGRNPQGDRLGWGRAGDAGLDAPSWSGRRSTRRSSASAGASSSTGESSSRWRSASVRSGPRRSASSTPRPPVASVAASTPAPPSPPSRRTGPARRRRSTCPRPAPGCSRTRRRTSKKAAAIPQYQKVLPGMELGMVALYQKCPHLGCRVPVVPAVAVVRVPVSRFEVRPRGREARRAGAARHGPLGRQHQRPEGRHRHLRAARDRPADRHRHDRTGRRRPVLRRVTRTRPAPAHPEPKRNP